MFSLIPNIIISSLSNEYTVNLAVGNVDPKDKTVIRNIFSLPVQVNHIIILNQP